MKLIGSSIFVISLLAIVTGSYADSCISRDFGEGGTVCVCNSDQCDTVERPTKIDQPQFIKYTSNKAGLRFLKEFGEFEKTSALSDNEIVVNVDEEFQTILGWGGAFTDSTGININSMPEKAQDNLMRSYFSEDGIEYSLCRVPIGGTDFSTHGYSYDDVVEPDPKLTNFNLTQEDFDLKIPLIKKALDLTENNLKLFASAWTAPKWMKTNGEYSGLGFLLNTMYQAWADYFVKFLESYDNEGIEFWGITTGNEPSLSLTPFTSINSVGWLPSQMRTWISENLGPTIRNSNYSDIKIIMVDDQRFFLPWYPNIVLSNTSAAHYIDGIGVHWYYDSLFPASILTDTHNRYPTTFILGTEACNGDKPYDKDVTLGSWDRGEYYSNDIIDDLLHWVTGWVDWNMVLDPTGGPTYIKNFVDSPVIVNASSGEFYKQPMFYHLGHFSKFISRDSIIISASSFDKDVPVIAAKRPDGGRVVVILNKKDVDVSARLVDDTRGSSVLKITGRSISTILYW